MRSTMPHASSENGPLFERRGGLSASSGYRVPKAWKIGIRPESPPFTAPQTPAVGQRDARRLYLCQAPDFWAQEVFPFIWPGSNLSTSRSSTLQSAGSVSLKT